MIAVVGVFKTIAGTIRLLVRGLDMGSRVLTAFAGGVDGMIAALTTPKEEVPHG